jgi:Protein of unknown function (DUF1353)
MAKKVQPRFDGEVNGTWLRHSGPDRKIKLTTDFAFLDSRGVRWDAPAKSTIDGASIPEIVWSSVVGTPYIGDYRRASVVHDVACQQKIRAHEEVHYMFYEAMICDGVTEERAYLMYTAVRLFGPKWPAKSSQKRSRAALRRFNSLELAKTLDHALGERTRWSGRLTPRYARGALGRGG